MDRDRFIERLIRLFRSLGRSCNSPQKRFNGIPEDFGWKETEAEYQERQSKWLAEVEKRRQQKQYPEAKGR
jgi:hypothetical protein